MEQVAQASRGMLTDAEESQERRRRQLEEVVRMEIQVSHVPGSAWLCHGEQVDDGCHVGRDGDSCGSPVLWTTADMVACLDSNSTFNCPRGPCCPRLASVRTRRSSWPRPRGFERFGVRCSTSGRP